MRTLIVGFTLALACAGCGPELPNKVAFLGQPATLQSGVQVNFQDAWARPKEIQVKLWMVNLSQAFMNIDRDGFALRLANGQTLPRAGAVHGVYTLPPGGGHEVFVAFRSNDIDLRTNQAVSLIVGGVSFSTDPRPRVVGEIPLVASGEHR